MANTAAGPPQANALSLPPEVLGLCLSHLPLEERLRAALVCRAFRAGSLHAWQDVEADCTSLEQWMALMRWLRPRMASVQKLDLDLKASLRATRSRFNSRCEAALCALADRLAAAPKLHQLSVWWDVQRSSRGGSDGAAASLAAFPLQAALLLPNQSRTARRAQRPLALALRDLELSCEAGVVLCPQLSLLPCLEGLTLGPGWHHREESAGPVFVQPHNAAACLPRTLKTLCLNSTKAAGSLADLGPDLAAGLPSLRELLMPVFPLSDWGEGWQTDVCRLLEALLPLAGQLRKLELPDTALPIQVARFTALEELVVPWAPTQDTEDTWDAITFNLGRLRSLDVCFLHTGNDYTLPMSLAALTEGLTSLRFLVLPPVQVSLPAGDYLRCLRHLTLGPMAALRITPLLPFMPDLEQLAVSGLHEAESISPVAHPRSLGSGDAALDAAAAAAAAIPLSCTAEQLAAAGQLAVALARHSRFQRLRLLPIKNHEDVRYTDAVACSLALRLSRLAPRVNVDVCFDEP